MHILYIINHHCSYRHWNVSRSWTQTLFYIYRLWPSLIGLFKVSFFFSWKNCFAKTHVLFQIDTWTQTENKCISSRSYLSSTSTQPKIPLSHIILSSRCLRRMSFGTGIFISSLNKLLAFSQLFTTEICKLSFLYDWTQPQRKFGHEIKNDNVFTSLNSKKINRFHCK